ncbi:hypothetical protein [Paracoccus sp. DMF]|uniref:hypothetical protein n=1 Tax=Paracoccus sp. DMF TaxID=400837 RepID=UPI0010FFD3D0|nr:hypothetical protein [Paracoccus sp. DMF]
MTDQDIQRDGLRDAGETVAIARSGGKVDCGPDIQFRAGGGDPGLKPGEARTGLCIVLELRRNRSYALRARCRKALQLGRESQADLRAGRRRAPQYGLADGI